MIVFPHMLENAAKEAGMTVPPDAEDFNGDEFPHFRVFCEAQLARPMLSPGEHWENAKIIANISNEKIKTVTIDDLRNLGFQGI